MFCCLNDLPKTKSLFSCKPLISFTHLKLDDRALATAHKLAEALCVFILSNMIKLY